MMCTLAFTMIETYMTYDKMKVDDLICSDFRDVITIFRFIEHTYHVSPLVRFLSRVGIKNFLHIGIACTPATGNATTNKNEQF